MSSVLLTCCYRIASILQSPLLDLPDNELLVELNQDNELLVELNQDKALYSIYRDDSESYIVTQANGLVQRVAS